MKSVGFHSGMDMGSSGASSSSSGSSMMMTHIHATLPSSDTLWFEGWTPSSGGAVFGAAVGLFLLAVFERFAMAFKRGAEVWWRRDTLRRLNIAEPPSRDDPTATLLGDRNTFVSSSPSYVDNENGNAKEPYKRIQTQPGASSSKSEKANLASRTAYTNLTYSADRALESGSYIPDTADDRLTADRDDRWAVPFVWKNDIPRGIIEAVLVGLHYGLMLVVMTFNLWYIIAVIAGAGVGEALFGRHGARGMH